MMSNIGLEQWMALASGLVLVVPVVVRWIKRGLPASLSGMVFGSGGETAGHTAVGRRALWTAWIMTAAGLLAVPLMEAVSYKWVAWLTLLCMLAVAVVPLMRSEKNTEHYVYGIAAGVMSQVCVALIEYEWLLVWLIWLPLLAGTMGALNDSEEMPQVLDGYGVLAAEVMCAVSLYGSLLCVI